MAFVQSSTSDHGCRCQVRLMHSNDQASLSLQLQQSTHLAGVSNNPPRHVVLHIQPLIVESCSIAEGTSISPLLLKSIPTSSLTSSSDVLTVALVLKSPGAVHYPKGLTSVRPTDPADVDFHAFVELCQATTIYIHFARAQFDEQETSKLSALVNGFDSEDLKAPYLNLGREDRGRGLQEGTWQVFSPRVFSPQASGSSHGETSSSLGKRSRQCKYLLASLSRMCRRASAILMQQAFAVSDWKTGGVSAMPGLSLNRRVVDISLLHCDGLNSTM